MHDAEAVQELKSLSNLVYGLYSRLLG
jgi:hypothetical protein